MLQLTCPLCYFSVRFHFVFIMMSSGTARTSSKTIPSLNLRLNSGIILTSTMSDSSSSQ